MEPVPDPEQLKDNSLNILEISETMEEDPQLFQQFKGHKDAITASHFSPNGKQVIQAALVFAWFVIMSNTEPKLRKMADFDGIAVSTLF